MSPEFGRFEAGQFNLTPQEREALKKEGRFEETEERIKGANEALRKKAGKEAREKSERDLEERAA